AEVSRPARRDRRGRRAHVRSSAQPLALHAALLQDADALRLPPRVEGAARAAARRAAAAALRPRATPSAPRGVGWEGRAPASRGRAKARWLRPAPPVPSRGWTATP